MVRMKVTIEMKTDGPVKESKNPWWRKGGTGSEPGEVVYPEMTLGTNSP